LEEVLHVDSETCSRAPLHVHRVLFGAASDQPSRFTPYAGRYLSEHQHSRHQRHLDVYGLAPSEMETRIVSIFERSLTTSVNNIEHIESQSLNGVAVIKVFLQPTANIDGAISEVIAEAQVGLKQFPPGITPPLVLSYDASSVPILQLG
jgi:hypothetical protein